MEVPLTKLRHELPRILAAVEGGGERAVITRNGRRVAVLVSINEVEPVLLGYPKTDPRQVEAWCVSLCEIKAALDEPHKLALSDGRKTPVDTPEEKLRRIRSCMGAWQEEAAR
ncbi:MAG: type II toxin-antitoxin system Phd/YefM family antitoxin [bacterium]|nr:type II toxin-antitoxin system Phd/YefM family antitoxin [bacterium]